MKRALLSIVLIAFITPLMPPLSLADTIYDSQGFEDPLFTTGPLNGQNGWIAYGANSGQEPVIITAPEPVMGSQAIRLEVPDFATATSYMEISVSDILAAGYDEITVSFDIYRQNDGFVSNLWWWWFDAGTPTYGLQWDEYSGQVGGTYPFGWDGTSMATIIDRYATIEMIWNFHTGEAMFYY